MIRSIFFFIFLFLLCALIPLTATAEPVNIADPNLRVAIEKTLGKAPGALITTTEMATLTELSAPNANITDLTGLEAATNLLRLYLNDRYVAVEGRFINSNAISNLSPLSGLTHLTRLHLDGNSITDLSPLVANTGFGQGAEIVVSENPLNEASINTHIPALQNRGVEVHFSNLKPLLSEYQLSLPAGLSLIHIPLKVRAVDGISKTINSIPLRWGATGITEP